MEIRKLYSILLLLTHLVFSCSSDTEQQGLTEIANYWGQVSMTKGFSAKTNEGNSKYVEIEVTNPGFFIEGAELKPVAGGIAFLFYKNLVDAEKTKYEKYSIILKDDKGSSASFDFPLNKVVAYFENEKIANQYYAKLLQGDLDYIYANFRSPDFPKDTLVNAFEPMINKSKNFDKIGTYKIVPLTYKLADGEIEGMHFEGIIFEKDSVLQKFSIAIDPAKKQKNIISIRYWE